MSSSKEKQKLIGEDDTQQTKKIINIKNIYIYNNNILEVA